MVIQLRKKYIVYLTLKLYAFAVTVAIERLYFLLLIWLSGSMVDFEMQMDNNIHEVIILLVRELLDVTN